MFNKKYSSEVVVLFGNSFISHLSTLPPPFFSLFVDPLSNSDRPSLPTNLNHVKRLK